MALQASNAYQAVDCFMVMKRYAGHDTRSIPISVTPKCFSRRVDCCITFDVVTNSWGLLSHDSLFKQGTSNTEQVQHTIVAQRGGPLACNMGSCKVQYTTWWKWQVGCPAIQQKTADGSAGTRQQFGPNE